MGAPWRKVQPKFWDDEKIRALERDSMLVALYLLTGPASNRCGLYVLSPARAADDLKLDPDTYRIRIGEVCEALGWRVHEPTRTVWIPTWWRSNAPDNSKHFKAILRDLDSLPRTPLMGEFLSNYDGLSDPMIRELDTYGDTYRDTYPDRYGDTLRARAPAEQEQEKEKEQEQEKEPPPQPGSDVRAPPARAREGAPPGNGTAEEIWRSHKGGRRLRQDEIETIQAVERRFGPEGARKATIRAIAKGAEYASRIELEAAQNGQQCLAKGHPAFGREEGDRWKGPDGTENTISDGWWWQKPPGGVAVRREKVL